PKPVPMWSLRYRVDLKPVPKVVLGTECCFHPVPKALGYITTGHILLPPLTNPARDPPPPRPIILSHASHHQSSIAALPRRRQQSSSTAQSPIGRATRLPRCPRL